MDNNDKQETWADEEVAEWVEKKTAGEFWLGVIVGAIWTLIICWFIFWQPTITDNRENAKVCAALDASHLDGFCVKDSVLIYKIP